MMVLPCATHGAALLAALFVLLAPLGDAHAGSFQVNPIRIELSRSTASAAITVRNDGAEPVVIQSSILAWSQQEGRDVYAATTEALVTPPIATIAPRAEQIVRVGLRRTPDAQRELTYRLFVQEVPQGAQPGFTGLQVALRIGVPVFVVPAIAAAKPLEWSANVAADGSLRLAARNRGNVHHRLSDFELRLGDAAGGAPIAAVASVSYVLAEQTREWLLTVGDERLRSARELRLKGFTDAGEIEASIKLER
jgi:fimbrial chaperone protein